MGGITSENGEKRRIHVALLAGADLIQTMSTPGLWAREDLSRILGHYGAFILERSGTDIGMFIQLSALQLLTCYRRCARTAPAVEGEHSRDPATHPERCLLHQDPPLPQAG
jgi:nicotinic acid mononucleotide adenylyltransferase